MELIAETAWHHQGEFSFLEKLVSNIVSKTQADLIKLHLTLCLEEYMAQDHSAFKDIEKWMFNEKQWGEIIQLVNSSDKELMLLFNDIRSVEFGMQFNPVMVEIHSVCLNDINLLSCLKSHLTQNTKVVLGVGGSSIDEVENAVNFLDTSEIVLMFGFQNYPTKYQDINFAKMRKIMTLFPEFKFGYADHTAWNEPDNILITLLGAALGMEYVEKHVTNVFGQERVDWSAAINMDMFNEIKRKMDLLYACNGDGLLRMNKGEQDYSIYGPMKKAALCKRDVVSGQRLDMDMLTFKRTGQVSDLSQVEVIHSVGKKVATKIKKGRVLMQKYLNQGKE